MLDREIWDDLARELSSGKGIIRRRVQAQNGINLFMAMDAESGLPAIIVESSSNLIKNTSNYTSTGFSLSTDKIRTETNTHSFRIILRLSESRFLDLFYILARDIAGKMVTAFDEEQALRVFLDRLSLWKSFFHKYKEKGMTTEEQQGMWGELWTMKNLLFQSLGIPAAVEAWMGPEEGTQDYFIGQNAIEVKTSTIPPHEKFQVSGIRQFDYRGPGQLLLVFLALETKPGKDSNLPALIDQIRCLISTKAPSTMDLLNKKLMLGGYLDSQAELYNEISYNVRKSMQYQVTGTFPRILEGNLPEGIGDVRYSVAVASCRDYAIGNEEFISIIKTTEC